MLIQDVVVDDELAEMFKFYLFYNQIGKLDDYDIDAIKKSLVELFEYIEKNQS